MLPRTQLWSHCAIVEEQSIDKCRCICGSLQEAMSAEVTPEVCGSHEVGASQLQKMMTQRSNGVLAEVENTLPQHCQRLLHAA